MWWTFPGCWRLLVLLPPLSSVPIPLPSYSPGSVRGLSLAAAVDDLLAKGAVEPVPPDPGFSSRLFVTPELLAIGIQLLVFPGSMFTSMCPISVWNFAVRSPVLALRGLDDFIRPMGRLSSGASASGLPQVSSLLFQSLSSSFSLFRTGHSCRPAQEFAYRLRR